jgi:hypothetical protein
MDTAVTIIQVLFGFLLPIGGLVKIVLPYAKYSSIPAVAWSQEFKPGHLHLLGVLEVLAGIGLLVPLIVPSLAMLAPLAAVGIALYMAGAIATHLRRSEYPHIVGILIVFLLPALFVAYGRLVGFAA